MDAALVVAGGLALYALMKKKTPEGVPIPESAVSDQTTTFTNQNTGKEVIVQNANVNDPDVQSALNFVSRISPDQLENVVTITVVPNELNPEVDIVSITGIKPSTPEFSEFLQLIQEGSKQTDAAIVLPQDPVDLQDKYPPIGGGAGPENVYVTDPSVYIGRIQSQMPFECISYLGFKENPYGPMCPDLTDVDFGWNPNYDAEPLSN